MKPHIFLISAAATIIGASALVSLEGCSNSAGTGGQSGDVSFERVRSEATFRLAGSATDYEAASDLSFNCSADMLMPTSLFGNKTETVQDSILKAAFDTTGVNHKSIIDAAFRRSAAETGYKAVDTTMTDSSYDGLYTVEGVVETLTPKIMSYAVTISDYLPRAAHGMYQIKYVNYDLADGKVFALSDIFTAEGMAKLPGILKSVAASMRDYIGATELKELPSGNNFCVNSDDELVFVYQPYEIASYSQGEIRIPIAAYMVSDYFTPYGNKLLMGVD